MKEFSPDFGFPIPHKFDSPFHIFRDNWSLCGPANILGINYDKISKETIELSRRVRDFYLGPKESFSLELEEDFMNLTYMFTDAAFALGSDMMVR